VLDAEGKPTGRTELKYGKDGEAGYLKWLAANHPAVFGALYGKLIPFDINAKVEEKTVVHYETVEERRAAMIAKGWHPSAVAQLEEAMEPKFLRDMRFRKIRKERKGSWLIPTPRTSSKRAIGRLLRS
jgi:hypothetical protein